MTTDLAHMLEAVGDPAKRAWWENYVKDAAFYGTPMEDTRRLALSWWHSNDHEDPAGEALALGSHPVTEVRLAGIAIMERILIPDNGLDSNDIGRLHSAMATGAFDDWNTCDWFCVKVLHRLMDGASTTAHDEVLAWSQSEVLWIKRASLVAFVNILPKREPSSGFDDRFVAAASTVANDQRRFCQTSIGWTMRELSVRKPGIVSEFLGAHTPVLSREAITNASKKLAPAIREGLLRAHASQRSEN
ncbi:MAG: DNA alkylation repair protein [Actinomycetota bacterium]